MPQHLKDKESKTIRAGDEVWTPVRGGKHQGVVEEVFGTEQEAQKAGAKNRPKVRSMLWLGSASQTRGPRMAKTSTQLSKVTFTDRHGHKVAHDPETSKHAGD
ncbi:uncharacterized protein MAM_05375 [Metarhizium album ARSEF 1941]|uniref:Hypervirulence associated protein TUDOR domain-containing protein n=1 Tax=Metarhizium album (strain ARSEF 1941) TaxID=1081103 RepID=A0A0B2WT72_METAS|nr:uncharacterized protein MAM_05375 [Metarhizium album ARSEF 1941]KHN96819.1 hypothetical protein MAM_05375 [Metarhizium album ARSEF 1941]